MNATETNNSSSTSVDLEYLSGFLVIPIALWITSVNLLTIITIARSSGLRQKRYVFIKSLAAVDFTTGVVLLVRATIQFLDNQHYAVCFSVALLVMSMVIASFFHLLALSLDRYIAVTRPLHYDVILSDRRCLILVAGSWVAAFAFPSLAFAWPFTSWLTTDCLPAVSYPRLHQILFLFTPYSLSIVGQTFMYGRVFLIARSQNLRVQAFDRTPDVSAASLKPLKVLLLMYGTSICMYLPFAATTFAVLINERYMESGNFLNVATLTLSVLFLNSGMNFVIYVWRDKEFRSALRTTLCKLSTLSG